MGGASTERTRMLAGELYDAGAPDLARDRQRARLLVAAYNVTDADAVEERRRLVAELLGHAGEGVWIEPPFRCDYGWNVTLEDGVFLNFNCVVLDCAPVSVGAQTQIGPGVHLCAATHPVDPVERATGREYALPIAVGRNVWIGAGAIVGPGVTIGDDAVVGAGSLVIRDVPSRVLAAGNPCRVIREL
jgi:maltose O-acetyltransferase